ncbi:RNA polymerase sigma-70 factor [Flagellimonas sp.]|uniref:RNA polymerase sigma-70 factor n=1 Tax=Flagellimonas sp. TaxID=2058762 RepID=UPI003B52B945
MATENLFIQTPVAVSHDSNESFEVIHDLYFNKLFLIARGYISSKQDAEEIVQDVFVKLWKKQEENHSIENLTGYLFRMTRNACLDFLRSKKNVLAIETNLEQRQNLLNFHALSNESASSIIEDELHKQVDKAIDQLPKKCRQVFVKSRKEGLKHKEIAKDLNISTKTVENHISKAIRLLKTQLREHFTFE